MVMIENKEKTMKIFILAMMVLLPISQSYGQESADSLKPCSFPESSQFDFWVGKWNLIWGEGEMGTNNVQKILDGCVIYEQFDGMPAMDYQGKSFSVFNKYTQKWHQTWVDSKGNYLDFTGGFADGKMTLSRKAHREGKEFLQKMVFHDIKPDSFTWSWYRSDDNGESWKLLWEIYYRRQK
jgi:hypothetical protein